jgi:hypothetical protein
MRDARQPPKVIWVRSGRAHPPGAWHFIRALRGDLGERVVITDCGRQMPLVEVMIDSRARSPDSRPDACRACTGASPARADVAS